MWVLPAFVLKWGTLIIYFLLWLFIIRMTPVCRSISLSLWFIQSSRWPFFFLFFPNIPQQVHMPARNVSRRMLDHLPLWEQPSGSLLLLLWWYSSFWVASRGGMMMVVKKRPKERRRNVKLVEDIFFFWSASTLKETLKSLWVFLGGNKKELWNALGGT